MPTRLLQPPSRGPFSDDGADEADEDDEDEDDGQACSGRPLFRIGR